MEYFNNLQCKKKITRTNKYWIHTEKEKLLDVLCGNTAFIFGYNNEYILTKMIDMQSKIAFINDSNFETCDELELLTQQIFDISRLKGLCWAVSGSDGVECSIYANDQYWKNIGNNKPLLICFDPCYHGATYLERIFRKEYPYEHKIVSLGLPDWAYIEERENAEKIVIEKILEKIQSNNKIGAILMESCPWVGSLKPWSKFWWQSLRKICDDYNINFIVDDTLGGVGKQGYYFSHLKYNVIPDIVSTGKSFTAGYTPLSVSCFSNKINDIVKQSWDFSHTWNPNLAGVGAALAVIEKFSEEDVYKINNRLNKFLLNLQSMGLIENFILQGLMLQIKISTKIDTDALLINGLNTTIRKNNTVFFCIPIIADEEYFYEFEFRLTKALKNEI